MEKINERPRLIYLVLLASALIGMGLIFVSTSRYGPGISPDSLGYLFGARNLALGRGLTEYNGDPFLRWPPFYPALLALFSIIFRADSLIVSRVLNAVLFGSIIFMAGFWTHRVTRGLLGPVIGCFIALFSYPLTLVSSYTWSEPLFIVLVMGFILALSRALEKEGLSAMILAAVFAGSACLTRYVGVTLIFTGALALLVFPGQRPRKKIQRCIVFSAVAGIPLLLLLARNYLTFHSIAGPRNPATFSAFHYLYHAVKLISFWFAPPQLPLLLRLVVAAFFIIAGLWLALNSRRGRPAPENRHLPAYYLPPALYSAVYIGFLALSGASTYINDPDHRYLSPIYLCLFLPMFAVFYNSGAAEISALTDKVQRRWMLYIFCAWLAYPLSLTLMKTAGQVRNGAGWFSTRAWHDSSTILYLQSHPLSGKVFSNNHHALLALTSTPAYSPYQYPDEFINPGDDTYLVWFKDRPETSLPFSAVQEKLETTPVAALADGTIYKIRARGH